jgi:hypothetical protein
LPSKAFLPMREKNPLDGDIRFSCLSVFVMSKRGSGIEVSSRRSAKIWFQAVSTNSVLTFIEKSTARRMKKFKLEMLKRFNRFQQKTFFCTMPTLRKRDSAIHDANVDRHKEANLVCRKISSNSASPRASLNLSTSNCRRRIILVCSKNSFHLDEHKFMTQVIA